MFRTPLQSELTVGQLTRGICDLEQRFAFTPGPTFHMLLSDIFEFLKDPEAHFKFVDFGCGYNQLAEAFAFLIEWCRPFFDLRGSVEAIGIDISPLQDGFQVLKAHDAAKDLLRKLSFIDGRYFEVWRSDPPEEGVYAQTIGHDLNKGLPSGIGDICMAVSLQLAMYLDDKVRFANEICAALSKQIGVAYLEGLDVELLSVTRSGVTYPFYDYLRDVGLEPEGHSAKFYWSDGSLFVGGKELIPNKDGLVFPGLDFVTADERYVGGKGCLKFMRASNYRFVG